jgi:hypothetical protein
MVYHDKSHLRALRGTPHVLLYTTASDECPPPPLNRDTWVHDAATASRFRS